MLRPKKVAALALSATLLAQAARAESDASTAEDPVLRGLVEEALARNAGLVAAQQGALAAEAKPAQAGSRPGPTLGLMYQNDGVGPSLGREQMTMFALSAGQDLPYPGKLALRRDVAKADAGVAGFEVERARLSLVASVKRAYYGLVLARSLAGLALEQREVWSDLQETARARYASAIGSQQEMLRAQIEATRLHGLHSQHHGEVRARLAELNALLGRPPTTVVETPKHLSLHRDERSPAEWIAWTETHSPELKAAALAVERDERAVSLARLEFKPDFNLQGGVMFRGALPPMWQVGASVMLPSRGRAAGALAEAQARLTASRARLEDVRWRLRSTVEQRLAFLQVAEQLEATYREGLLPQGQLAVESTLARYASARGSQPVVLEGVVAFLDDRTDYLRLLASHATERARLEEASLEAPIGMDSLLMHGRSRTPGTDPMEPAGQAPGMPAAGAAAMSSSRMEMR